MISMNEGILHIDSMNCTSFVLTSTKAILYKYCRDFAYTSFHKRSVR